MSECRQGGGEKGLSQALKAVEFQGGDEAARGRAGGGLANRS